MGAPLVAGPGHGMPLLDTGSHLDAAVQRDTKGGRRLWYSLRVIQQPERARACGSGPKSSADRRPVDPPPVVELRIYEGQTREMAEKKDITFVYNANFFLFATLEHERIIAHARGTPAPSTSTPPVLTGMPVSGMAYLDRPQEAGYFLFPDLSVRHEGRYRLTFNLYEETKEEKDKDIDRDGESQPPIPGLNPATGGSFDYRMEVKSNAFTVYSAKKFPGLSESTSLSRTVAEQGCRVRIRRDVRMRRRDGKGNGGDYENGEDEYTRRRRTATPDVRPDYNRARSTSGSTERTPYSAVSQRRPSMNEYQPQYPAQNPPSAVPQSAQSGGYLGFLGGNGSSAQQGFAQPPSVHASPVMSQSQAPYPTQPSYHHAPPPPPLAPLPQSYSRERTPSHSGYAAITPAPVPRHSTEYQSGYQSRQVTLPPLDSRLYHAPTPQNKHRTPQHTPLPSLAQISEPSMSTPNAYSAARSPHAISGPVNPYHLLPPVQQAGTKRTHGETFRQDSEPPRYQDGARDKGLSEDLFDEHRPLSPMYVPRADGRIQDANKFGLRYLMS